VLTATGGVTGTFAAMNSQWVAGGMLVHYSTTYGPKKVSIQITSIETLIPGDYNADGVVDTADYTVWHDSFGSNEAAADGNRNGVIDAGDYTIWSDNRGQHVLGAGVGAAVPEPTGSLLAGSALIGYSILRRREKIAGAKWSLKED